MKKMKKILSLALALLMLTAVMTSCHKGDPDAPKGMKLVESDFVNYKFYIPNNWIPDLTIGTVSAKTDDNSNVSVQTMNPSGSYKSADDYFRTDYFPKLQTTFKTVTLLEDESSIENQTVGTKSVPAVKYVYLVESDNTQYKIMQYFAVNAGYLYIFTYTAQEPLFAKHLEEVSEIIKNFVF